MKREFYLDIAASGLRLPVAADLVLHEQSDPHAVLNDPTALANVIMETAHRYKSPLAFPHMDLTLEKQSMLDRLGIPAAQAETFHFDACPTDEQFAAFERPVPPIPRFTVQVDALKQVVQKSSALPVGMSIGPFSLATKLMADPITPVFIAGSGMTAKDDPEVAMLERVLEISTRVVLSSVEQQCRAGAKAIFIAEPAANQVFFSPKQLATGTDIFERYAMASNRRVKKLLQDYGVDLIFHCCGDLIDSMVAAFTTLDPAILSLGSSRSLWHDATIVPHSTILYGNLPSKKFYSDEIMPMEAVEKMACELLSRMKEVKHPFILGSECDVLSVPGKEKIIRSKVDAFVSCACG